jgi:O-antigen ligase
VLTLSVLTEDLRRRYISVILSCGVVIGILAIYQYFIGFSHLRDFINSRNLSSPFIMDYLRQRRVFFPFVTPGILASYLIMVAPLAFLFKRKFLLLAPIFCALLLTGSLSALISLFLGALLYLLFKGELKGAKGLFLLGLFLLIPLGFFLRSASGKEHLSPLFSIFMRISYWRDSLEIIKIHPFLGIGLGNFNLVYSRYAHNSFLQFWAEAGLIGIASLCWFIYAVLASGVRHLFEKKENLVLLACLAVFILDNMLDFSFFLPEVSLIWWAILGLFSRPESQKPPQVI